MTTAMPNPFAFDNQVNLDINALKAVAGALDEEFEALPAEHKRGARQAEEIDIPVFLRDPSPAYLSATELMPIVKILGRYA